MALLEAYKPVRLRKYLIPVRLLIPEFGISSLMIVLKVAQLVSNWLQFIQLGTMLRSAAAKAGSGMVKPLLEPRVTFVVALTADVQAPEITLTV